MLIELTLCNSLYFNPYVELTLIYEIKYPAI